jgi:signal transduction histidine kinase/CheY-like chemotaxis protein
MLARQRARQVAALLGFAPLDQTRIATAVSEIARNAIQYAGGGKVEFQVNTEPTPGLMVRVQERGSGIKDLQAIVDGRDVSTTGPGIGLVGAKRLMDELDVGPSASGVTVTMTKALPKLKSSLTQQDVARVSKELAQNRPQGPLEELQVQNQELLRTLQELRDRQAEIAELHTRELDETNRGVVALYSELDQNAKELQRISELKTRFLSNMSHEFRSPLNTILSMSAFLLGGSSGELNSEQEKEIAFIRKAAEGLATLVNDLLDLAKVEAGKAVVRPEAFELAGLFENLRETTKPLLSRASVDLMVEEPLGFPTLHTDEGKVAQILQNFLSNAVKFTERGEIRLSAKAGPCDTIICSVTDTGIGIALKDQRRIFEEFNQIEGPIQKSVKGTGLGLPLTRKLADLLGGKVSVRSELGVGSTFVAVIPRCYRPLDESDAIAESRWRLDLGRLPVLVIDGDPVDLLLYEKYLEGSGFQALPARTLGEARRVLKWVSPVAVLLDVLLDAEGGWTLLTEMKSQAATIDIPIFVLTIVERKERALALGATDFCLKPIDRDWLLSRLLAIEMNRPLNKVLIIDDAEADRYLLKALLISQGRFAILEASSGEEGIQRAREEKPDVIFLDLIMPDLNGFEVQDRLRSDDATKSIPLILNTSAILSEQERARLTAGSAAILSKTAITTEKALESVREALLQAGLKLTTANTEP